MKGSIDSLRTDLQLRDERQTRTTEELGKRLTGAVEALAQEVRLRDSHQTENLQALSQKLDFAIDIRERLAPVEARLPKQ